jgi:hypothetical protein
MPDTALLFKLHEEFGRLINLHDWLMAFAGVVTPGTPPTRAVQVCSREGFVLAWGVFVVFFFNRKKSVFRLRLGPLRAGCTRVTAARIRQEDRPPC